MKIADLFSASRELPILSPDRLGQALRIGFKRVEFNRAATFALRDRYVSTRDREDAMVQSVCADFALADAWRWWVDESYDRPGAAVDVMTPWGQSIDNKNIAARYAERAYLLVAPYKADLRKRCDLYTVLAGNDARWNLCGWATAQEIFAARLATRAENPSGEPFHIMRQHDDLRSADSFFDYVERMRRRRLA